MACTSCNDSNGNKSKSAKSSGETIKSGFKSGMSLLIQAKKIWLQTAEKSTEPTQPEQNNNTNA